MAKSKVPLVLRASFTSTTSEQLAGEQLAIDLSAYVDALSGKVLKINSVWFSVDNGSGLALPTSDYEADAPPGVVSSAGIASSSAINSAVSIGPSPRRWAVYPNATTVATGCFPTKRLAAIGALRAAAPINWRPEAVPAVTPPPNSNKFSKASRRRSVSVGNLQSP